jgi:hypothetical protein
MVGETILGFLILIALIAGWVYSIGQRTCPHCGYHRNAYKSQFPICQKCGRDRTVTG